MITFLVSIVLLVIGYFTYGAVVEKIFIPQNERTTPAYANKDGVDFVPMSTAKNSMIQLLNIAGVGPIFGPILGALYGPVAFLWIVLGAIFAGAVHDYLTGMISIRNHGAHIPELAGKFLGKIMKHIVNFFTVLLLLLVGTVFVTAPAGLLFNLMDGWMSLLLITILIFIYYLLSTVLPIDKIIGRIYPFLGALLIISAVGIGGSLIFTGAPIPEVSLENWHPEGLNIFPLLFLTISCGALSGFHATQSPIISRTLENEASGRKVFYGMMITEAIIAMIWAAAAMSVLHQKDLHSLIAAGGPGAVVNEISMTMLGGIGGTLAVLGVIVLPITSGDTAFRSARMIIADYIRVNQKKIINRLIIALPLFALSIILTNMDFSILWRYFSYANQSTAMIALWVGAMYLILKGRFHWIASIPATFMTMVTFTYILSAGIGFGLDLNLSYIIGTIITVIVIALFIVKYRSNKRESLVIDVKVDEKIK